MLGLVLDAKAVVSVWIGKAVVSIFLVSVFLLGISFLFASPPSGASS